MWHWEVVFEDLDGNSHILYGKTSWEHWQEALEDYIAHEGAINKAMVDNNACLVLDENIVFQAR